MTDNIDRVQKKLEGRCLECAEYLPEHTQQCVLHPLHALSMKLGSLSQASKAILEQSQQIVEQNTDQLAEIKHMIDTIQNKDTN